MSKHDFCQAMVKQEIRNPALTGLPDTVIEKFCLTFSFVVQAVFWACDQQVLSAANQHSDRQSR